MSTAYSWSLLVFLWLILPAPLHGQGNEADINEMQAKEFYDRGKTLYSVGDYSGALESFQSAFDLHPHHRMRYNLGLCYAKLGERAKAAEELEQFVIGEGANIDPGIAGQVSTLLDEITKKIGVIYVTVAVNGADIFVDNVWRGKSQLQRGLYVKPGEHTVRIETVDGFEWKGLIAVKAGENREIDIKAGDFRVKGTAELTEYLPVDSRPARSAPAPGKKKPGKNAILALLGLTIASALAGGLTGIFSYTKSSEMEDLDDDCLAISCTSNAELYANYETKKKDLFNESNNLMVSSSALFAATGVFTLAMIIIYAVKKPKKGMEEKNTAAGRPSILFGGKGVVLHVTF
ncbi:MAG: tetratricopeptide repeat protein [Pseudomonadota bacterium]